MKTYRQGDVLLIQTTKLPESVTIKNNILALGEKTGHYHEIVGEVKTYDDYLNGVQWVVVENDASLEHKKDGKFTGDHSTLEIDPGIYRVIVQREYTPAKAIPRDWD